MFISLVLIFTSVFLLTFFAMYHYGKKADPATKRLYSLSTVRKERKTAKAVKQSTQKASEWSEKLLTRVAKLYQRDAKYIARIQSMLIQAGFYDEMGARVFIFLKIVTALVFMAAFGWLTMWGHRPVAHVIMIAFCMAGIGYLLPDIMLNFKIRKRQRMIAFGLPDALDLLVISVEAGLGLNAALLRVGLDIKLRSAPLSEELIMVNQDMRAGLTREKALRRLSDRNKVESLRILVGALVLADRLGTSIADTLRIQADSLRIRVKQRAEEQAAKASVKMLLPLVLFIMPALFIVLLGPGLMAIIKTFGSMGK